MKKNQLYRILVLVAVATMLVSWGCYNNLNPDYAEGEDGLHPFSDPAVTGHQEYFQTNGYEFSECTECHGEDLHGITYVAGGESLRSCFDCHSASNHPGSISDATVLSNHVDYLRSVNFDHTECLDCHALTTEGLFGGSCSSTTCHGADNGGPDACNVCHGNFAGDATLEANWAPPQGLDGVVSITDIGVGAHQIHMNVDTTEFAQLTCDNCHTVPATVSAVGHLDGDGSAEVRFGGIADNNSHRPEYSKSTNSCSSTYCHGNITSPVWTTMDGTYSACGSCHGDATTGNPNPHGAGFESCSTCHTQTVDASGNIIDGSLHVNGTVDVQL